MHLILLMQGAQLMAENQRLKQVIGLSLPFFVILFSIFSPFYFSHKKCLFHRWRIYLVLKHMYLNKVSHLSQSAIFATHLILLKTMTVQTLLSSWGKFVKFHWFQLFSLLLSLFFFFLGVGGWGFWMKYEIRFRIQAKYIYIKPQYLGALYLLKHVVVVQ